LEFWITAKKVVLLVSFSLSRNISGKGKTCLLFSKKGFWHEKNRQSPRAVLFVWLLLGVIRRCEGETAAAAWVG